MITLRHLTIFAAVAKYKKMNIAAKQLYVSQSTISQTIAELEKEYHVELFERFPKELRITPAGTVLLSHARTVIDSFDKMNMVMYEISSRHTLRIGATLTVGNSLICELLDALKEQNQAIDVLVHVDNTSIVEQKLLANELDIAIVEGIITSSEIHVEPILEDTLVVVASPSHPFTQASNITLSDLTMQDFILREKGSGTREIFTNFMREKHIPIRIKWECNSSNAIKQAVIHNYGLSVLSERLVKAELQSGTLKQIDCKDFSWKRYFSLCYNRHKNKTTEIKQFIQVCHQYKMR